MLLNDENTILLIDSWSDQKALDKHHKSSIIQEMIKLREKYDLQMSVKRFINDNDIPKEDKSIIRN